MIIEDDKIIAREMKTFLESWDYQGILVHDFHQVLEEWQNTNPDLILMDISLPYKNGYYWTAGRLPEEQGGAQFLLQLFQPLA